MPLNVSPGVYWKEFDISNYIPRLSSTILGVVTTAPKGPVNDRVLITNKDQLEKTFGSPTGDHFGLYTINQFLNEGNQVWVVRVESMTTPATAATATVNLIDGNTVGFESLDSGSYYNGVKLSVTHATPRRVISEIDQTGVVDTSGNGSGPWTLAFTSEKMLNKDTVKILEDGSQVLLDDGAGSLTGTSGYSGTVNYLTGEITLSFDTDPTGKVYTLNTSAYTTFGIDVIQTVRGREYTTETYRNLTLTPDTAGFYEDQLTGSAIFKIPTLTEFPAIGSYQMTGGDDGVTGITPIDYIGDNINGVRTGLKLFEVAEDVDINIITVPGQSNQAVVQALSDIAILRADCMATIDPPPGISPEEVVDWVDGKNEYSDQNALNSSFTAVYYPWIKVTDPDGGTDPKLIPPSAFATAAFARTDSQRELWWAPAGIELGTLRGVIGSERELSQGERNYLHLGRVNAINNFVGAGIVIYGQKTTQIQPTALDRINVRRTLTYIEKSIVTAMQPFVFKPNTRTTWTQIKQIVQPYLDGMVAREAIQYGEIRVDETTNTPEIIDRNELVANIFIKPTKTAEVITLNFVLVAQAAKIEEFIDRQF